jgi:hypothetical protein
VDLQPGEQALLEEAAALYETRSDRVLYGGGEPLPDGTVLVGGWSEREERMTKLDRGLLTLTTRRLVFDGTDHARDVELSDLLSVVPTND